MPAFTAKICARSVLLQLAEEDLANPNLKSSIDNFASARGIDSALLTVGGKLLFSGTRKIELNTGVWTLQNAMGLYRVPVRIESFRHLPDDFIISCFSDGYDEEKVCHTYGKDFERTPVNIILQKNVEKVEKRIRNREILSKGMIELVQDGTVSVYDVRKVEQAKKLLQRHEIRTSLKPDLDGPITLTFERWATVGNSSVKMDDYAPVDITIVGRPKQTDLKQKHYAIYSKLPGFGKTFQMKRLSEKYNVHFVNDPSNWTDIPSQAQFLVFDEVGHDHNKLNFENLRALTGGTAEAFTGNRKTFGGSFRPRNDVQVIMLSNESPYEIYGKWIPTLQRRGMTGEQMKLFQDRFEVFRLDGCLETDRIRSLVPHEWSEEQFFGECKHIIDKMFGSLTDNMPHGHNVQSMIFAIDMIVSLCRKREIDNIFDLNMRVISVLTELDNEKIFWPSLVDTYSTCYGGMAIKHRGRAMEIAFNRLVRLASIDVALFDTMRLEQLMEYVARRPSSVHSLYRFYNKAPHFIVFESGNKEKAFRACLSTHSGNATAEEEDLYRIVVFEKVWEAARENVHSSKRRKLN